VLVIIIHRE